MPRTKKTTLVLKRDLYFAQLNTQDFFDEVRETILEQYEHKPVDDFDSRFESDLMNFIDDAIELEEYTDFEEVKSYVMDCFVSEYELEDFYE